VLSARSAVQPSKEGAPAGAQRPLSLRVQVNPVGGLARGAALRWLLLGSLLVVEVNIVGILLDAAPLEDSMPQWWAAVFAQGRAVVTVATTTVAALLIVLAYGREQAAPAIRWRWSWWCLVGHLVAYAVFLRVAVFVFAGEVAESTAPGYWAAALALSGMLTVVLWAATALGRESLSPLARRAAIFLPASLLLGTAAWGAALLTERWWDPLRYATLWAVRRALGWLTHDLIVGPGEFVIGTSRFLVEIHSRCSGYEGIGLILVFVSAYLWLSRRALRFPQALLLLPIAIAAAWVANVARLVGLIAIGTWLSPEVAFGGFHSYAGWVLYCALALGLAWGAGRIPFFARHAAAAVDQGPNPTVAYVAPLLATVTAAMALGMLQSGRIDLLYPLRVVATAAVLWVCRRQYGGLRLAWSWGAVAAGGAAFIVWMAGTWPFVGSQAGSALHEEMEALPRAWAALWLSVRVLGAVVTVPLAEELAFRGYLTRRLIAADFQSVPLGQFSWVSFVVSSLLFGAMHEHALAATACGAIYALALYRRGNLGDAILAHATTNALLALSVFTTGSWWLWG